MATKTASVSGLWSDTATLGGAAVPVNGDAVVINASGTVLFNVDPSAWRMVYSVCKLTDYYMSCR